MGGVCFLFRSGFGELTLSPLDQHKDPRLLLLLLQWCRSSLACNRRLNNCGKGRWEWGGDVEEQPRNWWQRLTRPRQCRLSMSETNFSGSWMCLLEKKKPGSETPTTSETKSLGGGWVWTLFFLCRKPFRPHPSTTSGPSRCSTRHTQSTLTGKRTRTHTHTDLITCCCILISESDKHFCHCRNIWSRKYWTCWMFDHMFSLLSDKTNSHWRGSKQEINVCVVGNIKWSVDENGSRWVSVVDLSSFTLRYDVALLQ